MHTNNSLFPLPRINAMNIPSNWCWMCLSGNHGWIFFLFRQGGRKYKRFLVILRKNKGILSAQRTSKNFEILNIHIHPCVIVRCIDPPGSVLAWPLYARVPGILVGLGLLASDNPGAWPVHHPAAALRPCTVWAGEFNLSSYSLFYVHKACKACAVF